VSGLYSQWIYNKGETIMKKLSRNCGKIIFPNSLIGFFVVLVLMSNASLSYSQTTTRVNLDSSGNQATGGLSQNSFVSADGRYIAFESAVSNLVPGDTNGFSDIFVHDNQTGQTIRVSVGNGGVQAVGGASTEPFISSDGRYVAFRSMATNLVPGDTNGLSDIFVHDTVTHQTTRENIGVGLMQAMGGQSFHPSVSDDGRYSVFESAATNLVVGDTNGVSDIFLHDRYGGMTFRVTQGSLGQGNGGSYKPHISPDGIKVVFASYASNLVPGDTNGFSDIFIYNRQTTQTFRVSLDSVGAQGNGHSDNPVISPEGTFVAFQSSASNLVPGDNNGLDDIFIRDLLTGVTSRVSSNIFGGDADGGSINPSISENGRYAAFQSSAGNLVLGDFNNAADIFVYDSVTGDIYLASIDNNGIQGNGSSMNPSISEDGAYIAFESSATNLVPGDTNGNKDIFLYSGGDTQPTDITPPTGALYVGYGDATNTTTVTLTLSCSDTSDCTHMCISNTPSCSSWENFAEIRTGWTLTSGDETKTVYVWFRDGAGNETATPYSDDIVLDTTPPTVALSINSGAATTDTRSVTLTFSCTDVTGCSQICISNTPSCSSWEDFAETKTNWILPSQVGNNTVYAWFRDGVENETLSPSSDSIVVADITGPSTVATPLSGVYPGTRNITLICNDDISGCQTTYYCLGTGCTPTTVYNGPVAVSSSAVLRFYSVDMMNNSESVRSEAYTIDPNASYTIKVSVNSIGQQGNRESGSYYDEGHISISGDGRYVAFQSSASNLVPGDTNGATDVFVHDILTGQTTRVSVDGNGIQGNNGSDKPSISADGRYVAFVSYADNLVPGDNNATGDIFVHDRQTGQNEIVSIDSNGNQANVASDQPSISADGRYVAFMSYANNLVPGDTNGLQDVFVHDRLTGNTIRVNVDSEGNQGVQVMGLVHTSLPSISGDGRYIAFESDVQLTPDDNNNRSDVYVHDMLTGQTTKIILNVANDYEVFYDVGTREPAISADGRYVAFVGSHWDFGPIVYIHDRQTGENTQIYNVYCYESGLWTCSPTSYHPSISADGRYVAFHSDHNNLVPGDTNDVEDIFVHDRQTGQTIRASVDSNGNQANGGNEGNGPPVISADGRHVAFFSPATNLVIGDDTNDPWGDVFVHSLGNIQPTDSDGDGIPDSNDGCPNDPNKVQPGICGCGLTDNDSDSDGTPDCHDACPIDSAKVTPGICGCGIADIDSDSDGIADCVDQCPSDINKTVAGICGCGVLDTDTDNDGTADCHDSCPLDPNKINQGICGCNVADTDSDSDGKADCIDNCPSQFNPDQRNVDGDVNGDVCDICPADSSNTCDTNKSASCSIGVSGSTCATQDGSVAIIIPAGALGSDTSLSLTAIGSNYELSTNLGKATALFGVNIQPEGLEFLTPVTMIFSWHDTDNDGKIDGTTIKEEALLITKNNHAITDRCRQEAGCDMVANTFTFQVSSLSEFVLLVLNDEPLVWDIASQLPNDPLDAPRQVNTGINVYASFTDTGFTDIHTAVWDWGDGTTDPGIVNEASGEGTVTGSHIYTNPGVYSVSLTVTDDDMLSGTGLFQYVVIYDPNGGFVTGGGWINSPDGSYVANPVLTGKANFGFVSKYKKGATVPTGETEFQFKIANLNFHSDSYDWLVTAGSKAQYKGTGTINGAGNYGFMLTAIDGQITGGGGTDKFRIKILDKATDTIIYDNMLGTSDDSNPTTVIGGGSIVIHKK
jgi:Tol biopolymer transport system component